MTADHESGLLCDSEVQCIAIVGDIRVVDSEFGLVLCKAPAPVLLVDIVLCGGLHMNEKFSLKISEFAKGRKEIVNSVRIDDIPFSEGLCIRL